MSAVWCRVEQIWIGERCNGTCSCESYEGPVTSSSATVLPIRPDRASAAPLPPQLELIRALELMLTEAREGRITGLVGVTTDPPGNFRMQILGTVTHQQTVSALALAQFEAMLDWREKNASTNHQPKR